MLNGDISQCTILIVDDNERNLDILVDALSSSYEVSVAMDGQNALEAAVEIRPELILLDTRMPAMDGYEVIQRLKAHELTRSIPVIFLTAMPEMEDKTLGFQLGAVDYLTKPFEIREVQARVRTHLSLVLAERELRRQKELLDEKLRTRSRELILTQEATIDSLAVLAEYRDPETGGHIARIKSYVRLLAQRLMKHPRYKSLCGPEFVDLLILSSPLHDIGKLEVQDSILLKPDKLSPAEFEAVKRHTILGGESIGIAERALGTESFLRVAREISLTHHEKWDGTGYPKGLKGEEIPLSGRIMALADVYDALISKRVYKPPFSHRRAVELIMEGRDRHFDPNLVDVFLELQEEFRQIALEHADFEEERLLLSESLTGAVPSPPEELPVQTFTEFLPPEKLPPSEVMAQYRSFLTSDILKIAEVLPVLIVILNGHRQLVYGNRRFLDFLGVSKVEDILGKRLGEAVGCLHPQECNAECGTTLFCRYCGAARAIVASLAGGVETRECELNRKVGNILTALNLQVWMSQLHHAGQDFCVGMVIDIYHEKQMQVFEKLFFHDVLNLSGTIRGICNYFDGRQISRKYMDTLSTASHRLVDAICSHRDFLLAERQELMIQSTKMGSLLLLEELQNLFRVVAESKGIHIEILQESEDLFLITDRTLISRILGNLIKNALEASQEGDTVSLYSRQHDEGILFAVHNPAPMNEEVKAGVFKRSFTTKGMGRGLGTYSVRLFTETYLKGRVWFETSEEKGSTFFVQLPEA